MYPGNYSMYRTQLEVDALNEKESPKTTIHFEKVEVKAPAQKEKIKWSYKEKLEYEKLEKEIPELESKKVQLETKLSTPLTADELNKVSADLGKIMEEIDEKSMRWLELSELAG